MIIEVSPTIEDFTVTVLDDIVGVEQEQVILAADRPDIEN